MDGRVYVSSGRPTRDEKKMIEDLTNAVSKLKDSNPAEYMNFRPATNKYELREWYKKYCIEDAEIISETKTQKVSEPKEQSNPQSITDNTDAENNLKEAFNGANDPFNASETIKRDYVTDQTTSDVYSHEEEIVIEEPTGLPSDFAIPKDDDEDNKGINQGGQQQQGKQEKVKPEPVNPELRDLDDSQKRRVFKQTARSLVLAYKQFSGLPFKYIATRDINAAKMAEYDITGVLDTNVVLELPNDVHLSISQYFEQQCMKADGLFELDPDVEKEIEEALTDVLMEKQFALTPTQRLMVAVGQDLVNKGIQLFQFRAEVRTTLDYLKSNHAEKEEDLRKREEALKIKEDALKQDAKQKEDISFVSPSNTTTTTDITDAVVVEEVK